jgi:hyaluronan synthase
MPATLRGTFRQRLRWARSWWWMLPFAYARLNLKQLASPTVGLIELVITPLVLLWAVTSWVIGIRLRLSHPEAALAFIGAYAVIRIALSVLYLAGRPGMSKRQKMLSLFVGTPAAVLLNLLLLMPTRYYALARLHDNRWQTRTVKVKAGTA